MYKPYFEGLPVDNELGPRWTLLLRGNADRHWHVAATPHTRNQAMIMFGQVYVADNMVLLHREKDRGLKTVCRYP
jgi:hypothetical protein